LHRSSEAAVLCIHLQIAPDKKQTRLMCKKLFWVPRVNNLFRPKSCMLDTPFIFYSGAMGVLFMQLEAISLAANLMENLSEKQWGRT
jgi:hypothetical protein